MSLGTSTERKLSMEELQHRNSSLRFRAMILRIQVCVCAVNKRYECEYIPWFFMVNNYRTHETFVMRKTGKLYQKLDQEWTRGIKKRKRELFLHEVRGTNRSKSDLEIDGITECSSLLIASFTLIWTTLCSRHTLQYQRLVALYHSWGSKKMRKSK